MAETALPKTDLYLPGAGCLLCIMAATVANSSLNTLAKTLPYEDLPKIKDMLAEQLRKKGLDVVVIADDINVKDLEDIRSDVPNTARKDFSSLQKKYGIDKLLVVDIQLLGFIRNYSAYFPTGEPRATLQGAGYMVNLSNKMYEWYLPVNINRGADTQWDEPPNFPGLTNSYFQTIEYAKDAFLKPFSQ